MVWVQVCCSRCTPCSVLTQRFHMFVSLVLLITAHIVCSLDKQTGDVT